MNKGATMGDGDTKRRMYDTIVIGAGLSGLCAARRLEKYERSVLVLEAQDRVGGRTYTVQDPNHGNVDLGGAYVGPTQNRVYRLAKQLELEVYSVNIADETVLDLKGMWTRYAGIIPKFWNPFKLLDLNNVTRTLDIMAKQVPCEAPWKAPKAQLWDSMTVAQFLDTVVWTSAARELIEIFVRSVFCVETTEVSLLHCLWQIHNGGGMHRLSNVENGAQEKKFYKGSQEMSTRMAKTLNVKLSSPVSHVDYTDDIVVITDKAGNQYKTKFVICAVPPPMVGKITFNPPLPWQRIQLMQRMPMGSIIKTVMFYDDCFWRNMDLNGSAVSADGVCSFCIDDTKPDGSHPAIMGFVLADKARQMAKLSKEERQRKICKYYAQVFRCEEFLSPVGYMECNWMSDQYIGGGYNSVLPPKLLTTYAKYLREPVEQIFFAGTETATQWVGYMDGAIQAGERAANQVLHELGEITALDIYEEEPESIDYPAKPVPFSYLEYYLPSNTALFRVTMMGVAGFIGYSLYFFIYGWRGAVFLRWLRWRYDLDDSAMYELTRYAQLPTRFWGKAGLKPPSEPPQWSTLL